MPLKPCTAQSLARVTLSIEGSTQVLYLHRLSMVDMYHLNSLSCKDMQKIVHPSGHVQSCHTGAAKAKIRTAYSWIWLFHLSQTLFARAFLFHSVPGHLLIHWEWTTVKSRTQCLEPSNRLHRASPTLLLVKWVCTPLSMDWIHNFCWQSRAEPVTCQQTDRSVIVSVASKVFMFQISKCSDESQCTAWIVAEKGCWLMIRLGLAQQVAVPGPVIAL